MNIIENSFALTDISAYNDIKNNKEVQVQNQNGGNIIGANQGSIFNKLYQDNIRKREKIMKKRQESMD